MSNKNGFSVSTQLPPDKPPDPCIKHTAGLRPEPCMQDENCSSTKIPDSAGGWSWTPKECYNAPYINLSGMWKINEHMPQQPGAPSPPLPPPYSPTGYFVISQDIPEAWKARQTKSSASCTNDDTGCHFTAVPYTGSIPQPPTSTCKCYRCGETQELGPPKLKFCDPTTSGCGPNRHSYDGCWTDKDKRCNCSAVNDDVSAGDSEPAILSNIFTCRAPRPYAAVKDDVSAVASELAVLSNIIGKGTVVSTTFQSGADKGDPGNYFVTITWFIMKDDGRLYPDVPGWPILHGTFYYRKTAPGQADPQEPAHMSPISDQIQWNYDGKATPNCLPGGVCQPGRWWTRVGPIMPPIDDWVCKQNKKAIYAKDCIKQNSASACNAFFTDMRVKDGHPWAMLCTGEKGGGSSTGKCVKDYDSPCNTKNTPWNPLVENHCYPPGSKLCWGKTDLSSEDYDIPPTNRWNDDGNCTNKNCWCDMGWICDAKSGWGPKTWTADTCRNYCPTPLGSFSDCDWGKTHLGACQKGAANFNAYEIAVLNGTAPFPGPLEAPAAQTDTLNLRN